MLNVRGLTVKYSGSDTPAVCTADIVLEKGSITSLVGESGSGKSTVINAILGLLPKSAEKCGEICFGGRNLLTCSEDEFMKIRWEGIALVSQGAMNSFTPVLSVGRQIKEVLAAHLNVTGNAAEQRTAELLEAVGLDASISKRYPHELSGGQKQRAAIACALACSPQLLLADEPTTALDVITQAGILKLLEKLRKETGITILLVTHDLPMAASVSDNLLVMKDGVIVERGSSRELTAAPRTDYAKKLLAAIELPAKQPRETLSDRLAVNAEEITVRFESKNGSSHTAVDGISLNLRKGETLAIVGESGSGKTTLLRTLMGLQKASLGSVQLFGKRAEILSEKERSELFRLCGYVPQDPYGALPPGLTALEAVMEPFVISGSLLNKTEQREAAEKLLADVGLRGERILNSRAVALSGGQRQRVELARALALSPKLLLCDEPTSMQDVSTRTDIIELLESRVEQGTSLVFVTHDLMLAASAAEKIMVMKDGRLCEYGNSCKVLCSPKHPYTRALLESVPKNSAARF